MLHIRSGGMQVKESALACGGKRQKHFDVEEAGKDKKERAGGLDGEWWR